MYLMFHSLGTPLIAICHGLAVWTSHTDGIKKTLLVDQEECNWNNGSSKDDLLMILFVFEAYRKGSKRATQVWNTFHRLVKASFRNGIRPTLGVTFWNPSWYVTMPGEMTWKNPFVGEDFTKEKAWSRSVHAHNYLWNLLRYGDAIQRVSTFSLNMRGGGGGELHCLTFLPRGCWWPKAMFEMSDLPP